MAIIIKQLKDKSKVILLVLISIYCIWSPIVVYIFDLNNIYSNIFFRSLEFTIGILIASLIKNNDIKIKLSFLGKPIILLINTIILILSVTIAVKLKIGRGNYMLYNIIAIPLFILLLIGLVNVKESKLLKSNSIQYMSSIAYSFFLAQFFTWRPTVIILNRFSINNNTNRIILSFTICLILSIIMHTFIEKPSKKVGYKLIYKLYETDSKMKKLI